MQNVCKDLNNRMCVNSLPSLHPVHAPFGYENDCSILAWSLIWFKCSGLSCVGKRNSFVCEFSAAII